MSLTKNYTAQDIWAEANRDVSTNVDILQFERFDIINRASNIIYGEFYSLALPFYKTSSSLTIVNDSADISAIPLNILGSQLRFEIDSTAVPNKMCEALSINGLKSFRPSASHNRNKIVYAISGNTILFRKGNGLSSYDNVTLRYTRLPVLVAADTDKLDVPDPIIELIIIKVKMILNERYNLQKQDYREEMQTAVKNAFEQFSVIARNEEIVDKVKALI